MYYLHPSRKSASIWEGTKICAEVLYTLQANRSIYGSLIVEGAIDVLPGSLYGLESLSLAALQACCQRQFSADSISRELTLVNGSHLAQRVCLQQGQPMANAG